MEWMGKFSGLGKSFATLAKGKCSPGALPGFVTKTLPNATIVREILCHLAVQQILNRPDFATGRLERNA